jgi:hypothetical protein
VIFSKEILKPPLDLSPDPSYNINSIQATSGLVIQQENIEMARNKNTEEVVVDGEEVATEKASKVSKSKKAPLPEGWVTPVQFAKLLTEQTGKEVRPQIIYGYVKSGKDFPCDKTNDRAAIVHLERALAWVAGKDDRKAARQAAKAAKAETVDA